MVTSTWSAERTCAALQTALPSPLFPDWTNISHLSWRIIDGGGKVETLEIVPKSTMISAENGDKSFVSRERGDYLSRITAQICACMFTCHGRIRHRLLLVRNRVECLCRGEPRQNIMLKVSTTGGLLPCLGSLGKFLHRYRFVLSRDYFPGTSILPLILAPIALTVGHQTLCPSLDIPFVTEKNQLLY